MDKFAPTNHRPVVDSFSKHYKRDITTLSAEEAAVLEHSKFLTKVVSLAAQIETREHELKVDELELNML